MMFSGGKDSVVVRHLLESCGINHVKYYYMASGIEGPYLKNYLLENYPDVEWLIPKTNNVFEEWKQRKFVPYSMAKDKRYIAALQRFFCCKSHYLLKANALRPYTLTLNTVENGYWKVNGVNKAAGSYTYSHGTSLTVECFANDGYVKPTELTMS